MIDYKELIAELRKSNFSEMPHALKYAAAAIEQLVKERDAAINELCMLCGKYKKAHEGSCNGCRFKK